MSVVDFATLDNVESETSCPCVYGKPIYLSMFPDDKRVDAFVALGHHPKLRLLAGYYRRVMLVDEIPPVWRVALGPLGTVVFYDPTATLSRSFHQVLYGRCYDLATFPLDCQGYLSVGSSYACDHSVRFVSPRTDGYCYLALYPIAEWALLALRLGPWPTLAQLPAGRYPAVAKKVVADFLAVEGERLALHCAPSRSLDSLAAYPPTAVVGGGLRELACANLSIIGGKPCKACHEPLKVDVAREVGNACVCSSRLAFSGVSRAEVVKKRAEVREAIAPGASLDVVFLRGDKNTIPVNRQRCPPVEVTADTVTAARVHSPDGRSQLGVSSNYWVLYVPPRVRLTWASGALYTDNWSLVIGAGVVWANVDTDLAWLLVRGCSRRSWQRFLHLYMSMDPAGTSARFTTWAGADLCYVTTDWYKRFVGPRIQFSADRGGRDSDGGQDASSTSGGGKEVEVSNFLEKSYPVRGDTCVFHLPVVERRECGERVVRQQVMQEGVLQHRYCSDFAVSAGCGEVLVGGLRVFLGRTVYFPDMLGALWRETAPAVPNVVFAAVSPGRERPVLGWETAAVIAGARADPGMLSIGFDSVKPPRVVVSVLSPGGSYELDDGGPSSDGEGGWAFDSEF